MQLSGKRTLVVGCGRSGLAAARFLVAHGASVTLTDTRSESQLAAALGELAQQCTLELGTHRLESFTGAQLIVLSPGVPPLAELDAARSAGVPVIGEVELASRFIEAPIIAITGTNGKSTTTQLAGDMLRSSGFETFIGGNLGTPLIEAVGTPATGPNGRVVVELSSFQLETVAQFHAAVAVLLNLSEDHLDRYPNYEAYVAAKARIFERQGDSDLRIVGQGVLSQLAAKEATENVPTIQFAVDAHQTGIGGWVDGNELVIALHQGANERYARDLLKLPGRHNSLNALAALLMARALGATQTGCQEALAAYRGLPDRMAYVATIAGVDYFNDSKATNVGAVIGSLTGFGRPVVLIAGGKDKGGDYAPLIPVLRDECKAIVLLGAAAPLMDQALSGSDLDIHRASSMADAVAQAAALATPGDAVVLSPACSSYDMYDNYHQRGLDFANIVAARSSEPSS